MEHLSRCQYARLFPVAVRIISHQRMSDIGAVNPYLMRPSSFNTNPKERCLVSIMLDDLEIGPGMSTRAVGLSKKKAS